ncbi:MAG: glycosyltransferase [Candidatus Zixiibacteriota bacterium]|nr:MAG: glycosyltransferase [candidate division Zixibacteria bacterium]
MTVDTYGGVWDYAMELTARLAEHGVRTILATMGQPLTSAQAEAVGAVPGLILEQSRFKLEWMPDVGDDVERSGQWLLALEQRFQPDLVHLNGYSHALLPWKSPCMVVAHSCILTWWQAVKGTQAPPAMNAYSRMVARALRNADRVVTPTRELRWAMERFYGPLPHVRTIWNGRRPADFGPQEKQPIIFTAGRLWDEAKNAAALDAVAPQLEWPVFAAGSWRRPDGSGSPPRHLTHLGILPRREMNDWFARAAIFAEPAYYEPFGLSVLEAALSGCALVLGNIPTLRELWEGAAVFVPPGDAAALRERLLDLIRDPEVRAHLGRLARERAQRYSSEHMAQAYAEVYSDMVARHAARDETSIPALA